MAQKKSWMAEQINEARKELGDLPTWVKESARFAGGEVVSNEQVRSPGINSDGLTAR